MPQLEGRGPRLTAVASGLAVAAAAALAGTGVVADASPVTGLNAVRVHLAYNCRSSTGSYRAGVTIAATFPQAGVGGQPIQPTGLRTVVALPPAATASLRKLGAATITARDTLGVSVAYGAKPVTARWPGRLAKPIAVPTAGRLLMRIPGHAAPITVSAPGAVALAAHALTLVLAPGKPAGSLNDAVVPAVCTLVPRQNSSLATIPVAAPAPGGATKHGKTPPTRNAGAGGNPPGCGKRIIHGGTSSPLLGCAYLVGYADVGKLKEAALIGPAPSGSPGGAQLNVDSYSTDIGCIPKEPSFTACAAHHGTVHTYTCTAAQLNYHGQEEFPPATATFLNFRFVPVTAVMQLAEAPWPSNHPAKEDPRCYTGFNKLKPVRLKSPLVSVVTDIDTNINLGEPILNVGTTFLSLRVSQVTVNGVPLNVGPDCGAGKALRAVLTGKGITLPKQQGYSLNGGGPLTGSVTIPQFTHCGVGENLDPLLNASISGPANFQLITQGPLCTPAQGDSNCPPAVPKPLRHVKPLK